ncbi:hypothetical protein HYW83_03330 [Candidatus Peregrinibacteria bacterium]|nr:hypothetical protein [Candidatus Peregrinibacteria bacterium]
MLDESFAASLSEPVRREYIDSRAAELQFAGRKPTREEMRSDPYYAQLLDEGWCFLTNINEARPASRGSSQPGFVDEMQAKKFDLVQVEPAYLYGNPACGRKLGGFKAVFYRPTADVEDIDFAAYAVKIGEQGGRPMLSGLSELLA